MKKSLYKIFVSTRYMYHLAARYTGVPAYQVHQIFLPEQDLLYIPVPKNASSSIKHALYHLEYNKSYNYSGHREWGYQNIHDFYNKRDDAFTGISNLKNKDRAFRFTVVRDPVERFLSFYRNRVLQLEDLRQSKTKLDKVGLSIKPELDTFIDNFNEYRTVNRSIRHHTRLQSTFLGNTLNYLDEVYPFEEMKTVQNMLKSYNESLIMTKEKSSQPKLCLRDLSPHSLRRLFEFYKKDYELLANFYSTEAVLEKYQSDSYNQ